MPADDRSVVLKQKIEQMAADESGSASDEDRQFNPSVHLCDRIRRLENQMATGITQGCPG